MPIQMGASGFTSRSAREVKTSIGAAADSPTTLDIQTVSKYSKLDIFFVPFATRQCRASFFFYVGYDPTISRFLIFLQFGPIYAW